MPSVLDAMTIAELLKDGASESSHEPQGTCTLLASHSPGLAIICSMEIRTLPYFTDLLKDCNRIMHNKQFELTQLNTIMRTVNSMIDFKSLLKNSVPSSKVLLRSK